MAQQYSHLDDVPHSVRQALAVASPAFSVVTDSTTPEALHQSQVMIRPSDVNTTQLSAGSILPPAPAAASADNVQVRLQQMLQIQAPIEVLRLLQTGQHEIRSEAKTAKEVQVNVQQVASELEARTERLASCLLSLTNDMEGMRLQSDTLFRTANEHHGFLKNADNKLSELFTRVQQIEQALSALSRGQVSFESSIKSRIDVLEHEIQKMQTSKTAADALQGEMASMKAIMAKLEAQHHEQEGRARNRYEEIMKSVSSGHERSSELDTRMKLAMERIVGSERLREKLRKADADLETQFRQLKGHIGDESQQQHQAAATIPSSSDSSQSDTQQTPRAGKGPVEFKMTPQLHDVTWEVDKTAGWYEDGDAEGTRTRPQIGVTYSPPGLPKHMRKAVEVPQSSWKLLKDMPKLNASAAEAWEGGVAFRQWTTEMAAISEAIHPSFAEYFRNKLDEGRLRYEKRLEQGFDEPPPAVRSEDRELETRLSLALLKILPAKMKTHALERGNTLDGISVAALLEAIYEQMTPGGIREKNSLLQYLRSPPASNTGEELTATLRRYRLAQQRARHLDIPQQAAHETIAALDTMVKPLERKHQPLSVRLGILRLQSNIQIPPSTARSCILKFWRQKPSRCKQRTSPSRRMPKWTARSIASQMQAKLLWEARAVRDSVPISILLPRRRQKQKPRQLLRQLPKQQLRQKLKQRQQLRYGQKQNAKPRRTKGQLRRQPRPLRQHHPQLRLRQALLKKQSHFWLEHHQAPLLRPTPPGHQWLRRIPNTETRLRRRVG